MYCKHCGKEIADDSKFCQHCGAIQELDSTSMHEDEKVANKQNSEVSYSSYIWRRILGSAIDKLIILLLCLGITIIISCFDYGFGGKLGIFGGLFQMTKDSVYSAAIGHVMSFYPSDSISLHQLEIDNRFQFLIWLELKIVFLFILINILYYGICEKVISSSIGKSIMNLRLVSVSNSTIEKLTLSKVLYRVLCFFLLISGIIGLRWLLGFNYYIAVVLFFLIMDLPVLFKRASLLDILTKTKLILFIKDKSKKEVKTHTGYVEKQVVEDSNKVNRKDCKFGIGIFLILIFLISLHVYYSVSYANYKIHYTVGQHNYNPIYNVEERFAGCGYHLSKYEESRVVKKLLNSSNILGSHISTLGFQDKVVDYSTWYQYQCYISTYDISNIIPIIGNVDKIYEECLSQIAQRTQAKEILLEDSNIKAITWYEKGVVSIKYFGICTNERLYIIETISERNLDYRSNWLLSLFDFSYYPNYVYYVNSLSILVCLIGIFCILFFVVNIRKFKSMTIKNRYAYSLFVLSLLSIIINIILACIISYMLEEILFDLAIWSIIILVGAEATAIISSLLLSVFYYRKSKIKWEEYYLVPSVLKNYFFHSLKNDKERKCFYKLVCYPLMILSLLPCGIYIALIFSIPLLMVLFYNKWCNWASASKINLHEE